MPIPWSRELARRECVERRENAISVGNSGTGRTHVALNGWDWPLGSAGCPRASRRSAALARNRSLRYSASAASGSILVTTDLSFGDWIGLCGWERVTGELVDLLTHHVHILEMHGESFRLKRSRESAASQASEEPDEE